jgi:hypothetical protein
MVNEADLGLKDSGTRQEFAGGAVRDKSSGKGRYDLCAVDSFNLLADAVEHDPIAMEVDLMTMWEVGRYNLGMTLKTGRMDYAIAAMRELASFIQIKFWNENNITPTDDQLTHMPTHAYFRVARVYEKGALKYAARNWEKGINLARFLDSSTRHWMQVLDGADDEDHAGQALWNIVGWIQTRLWIDEGILPKSFDDMPVYKQLPKVIEMNQVIAK